MFMRTQYVQEFSFYEDNLFPMAMQAIGSVQGAQIATTGAAFQQISTVWLLANSNHFIVTRCQLNASGK